MYIPEAVKTYGFIFILVLASFWGASRFIEPAPDAHIVIAAGSKTGAYYAFAQKYKEALEKQKISLEILETGGSQENLRLLQEGKADAAFMQSGIVEDENIDGLEALSSLYFEPLWVFVRQNTETIKSLADLKGKTLAIGGAKTGTITVVKKILSINGIHSKNTKFQSLGAKDGYKALLDNKVSASFMVGGYESPLLQELLHDPHIKLMNFRRSSAYAQNFKFLSKVTLPEGIIDFKNNIPALDTNLVSPVAMLVVKETLYGSFKSILLQTLTSIHNVKSPYTHGVSFPTLEFIDFPLSSEASRYYKYGPSILQRFLPFWLADMINRMKVMLIPLIGVLLPLIKIAPPTYRWRVRSKIYRCYKDLKAIEAVSKKKEKDIQSALKALKHMDDDVKNTHVPLSYAEELYNLRLHIKLVEEKIQQKKMV